MPLARYNPDKRCIFRQVFNTQADIDKNPYNKGKATVSGTVKFQDGATLAKYPTPIDGAGGNVINPNFTFPSRTISVRIIFTTPPIINTYILLFDTPNNRNLNISATASLVASASWNIYYINGISGTRILQPNTQYEIVVVKTADSLRYDKLTRIQTYSRFKLFEIYNTILSPSEIKNLYNNKTLMPFTDSSEIFHLNAYKGVINDKMGSILTNRDPTKIKIGTYGRVKNSIIHTDSFGYESIRYIGNLFIPVEQTYSFWMGFNWKNNQYSDAYLVCQSDGINYQYIRLSGYAIRCFNAQFSGVVPFDAKHRHYTITKDLNHVYKLYVNGVLTSTVNSTAPTYYYGTVDFFNRYANHGYAGVICSLINFRIFNKVLTDEQISQIYNSERKQFSIK